MSQRHSNRPRDDADASPAALKKSIEECFKIIIAKEGSKIPIKRIDINNHLKNFCQTPTNQLNTVINEANKLLQKIYGYKLMQVDANGIQYIVVLKEECESSLSPTINDHHRKLLTASLMHIFMSGSSVREDDLFKFLKEARLLEENDKGGRELLKHHFTRQMYLQYTKEGEGELARHVFKWGQRATAEIPKSFILNKIAAALNKTPDYWYEQYREATQDAVS